MKNLTSRLVPIRTVCAMYNLNPNTLRTWERRYGIIQPKRSEGGHRAYGEADLANIEAMLHLISQGYSVSDAAREARKPAAQEYISTLREELPRIQDLRARLRAAVKAMQQGEVLNIIHEADRALGYQTCVEQIVFPELNYWGRKWEEGTAIISSEHVTSLAAKSFLLEKQKLYAEHRSGPVIVVTCAPGENHDLPVLHLANLVLRTKDISPLVLIDGLPIEDIVRAAEKAGAAGIVMSATIAPRAGVLREWISHLGDQGWEGRTILVGCGFAHSRIFSRSGVRAATGTFEQVVALMQRVYAGKGTQRTVVLSR